MSLDVTSNRFQNKDLDEYDVMQHVRNLYNILGVILKEDMTYGNATNVVERLDAISKNPLIKGFYKTVEEYQNDLKAGIISPNDIYYIDEEIFTENGEIEDKVFTGDLNGTADRAIGDQYGNNIADTYVAKEDNPYAIGKGIELFVDANGILNITYDDGIPEELASSVNQNIGG